MVDAIAGSKKAIEINSELAISFYCLACCYVLQNKISLAIENLDRAINIHPQCREMARTNPNFDRIRSDASFQDLIE